MKFYSKVEPVHLYGAGEPVRTAYSELPLQPLQNARKEEDQVGEEKLFFLQKKKPASHIFLPRENSLGSAGREGACGEKREAECEGGGN